jgi:phage shock protein A
MNPEEAADLARRAAESIEQIENAVKSYASRIAYLERTIERMQDRIDRLESRGVGL